MSKTKIFTGDPNKLTPITLLTTFRKKLTSILNTRITDIIQINIPELTYADDLTLMTDNKENLQKMVDITNDYLKIFNMKANPNKSKIVSNQKHTDIKITLNDEKIREVKKSNELVRILGVFLTLDGSHNKTTEHAKNEAFKLINQIKHKYRPGEIAT